MLPVSVGSYVAKCSHYVDYDRERLDWFHSVYRFTSTDLKMWKRELAIPQEGGEHLFNCSLCRDDQGFLMAYESNLPMQFCFKFAQPNGNPPQ